MKNEYREYNHRSDNTDGSLNGQTHNSMAKEPQDNSQASQIADGFHPELGVNRLSKDYPFTEPDNGDLRALCQTFQHVLASAIEVAYEWGTRNSYPELLYGSTNSNGRKVSNHNISMNMANRILYRLEYERDNNGEYTYSAHFSRLLFDLQSQLDQAAKILKYSGSPKGLSFSEAAIHYLKSLGGDKQ